MKFASPYSPAGLIMKTLLWMAARFRRQRPASPDEVFAFRREIERLKSEVEILRKRLQGHAPRRHTWQEKLHILWHMEVFQVPRRKVRSVFGISRSTYYRWLQKAQQGTLAGGKPYHAEPPSNRTPDTLANLVWELFDAAPNTGRLRMAQMVQRLGVFLSPTTIRNILRRARPQKPKPDTELEEENPIPTSRTYPGIVARYPNHVWSVDLTVVNRWMLWPTYVLVAVDHFSRKAVSVKPLEGPNAGWVIDAMEDAFQTYGAPRHLISDQGSVFTGQAFKDELNKWNIQHRLGAIGQHGSIAVTERLIKTLKYEWLFQASILKGFNWLTGQCENFRDWYNEWRPHSFLVGATPDEIFFQRPFVRPPKHAKTIPPNIEIKVFPETKVTAYRLKKAA